MILEKLRGAAKERLHGWAGEQGLESPAPVALTAPPGHVSADVSCAWPLAAGKALRRKPLDVAAEAARLLAGLPEIEAAETAPPGFVNVRFAAAGLARDLAELVAAPGEYGRGAGGRDLNLEYVSANPTGPVHVASARAATLGDSLSRILRRRGHKVRTEYYVNDAGRQVEKLGLSVAARWRELHGRPADMPEDGYQGDYIKDLAAKAPSSAESWGPEEFGAYAVEAMLAQHKADMEAFGAVFDRWFRESDLHAAGALEKTLAKLKSLGRVYEKDGATWLGTGGEDGEDDKDRVLIRQDGRPTYFLADIAYHQDKLDRGATELIDILGADHHGYVPRMMDAIAALGCPKGTFRAIVHQLVHLYRGKEKVKMSKRAGEFVTLRDLVTEAGLDACRFFFAMRTPHTHMDFDIELAKKQSNENPVFYVQYVHARIRSIFREAVERGILPKDSPLLRAGASADEVYDESLLSLTEPAERALLVKLAWFPEALAACEKDLSPNALPTYLMELAGLYHKFYEDCRVLAPEEPARTRARLTLCAGVAALIAEGLGLLGVGAPERM